ncbi:MAG: pyridoxamine 5'-phosphate oxidase family protein [Pseudomonadota bacterium]
MTNLTLADISRELRSVDTAMLMTCTEGGRISGRPMKNSQDGEYDGDSYYFAWGYSRVIGDLEQHPHVALSFQTNPRSQGNPLRINVEGRAEVIRDRNEIHEHWSHRLDHWFDRGPDTPGLVMIKVHAQRVHYWNGGCEGEILLE